MPFRVTPSDRNDVIACGHPFEIYASEVPQPKENVYVFSCPVCGTEYIIQGDVAVLYDVVDRIPDGEIFVWLEERNE